MSPTILAVFAHPDDESACSGTLAMGADRGWRVILAVATRGEAGEIADSSLATPQTLGVVREVELNAACEVLGIEEVRFLGYCDSGMAGTPQNDLPSSFFRADPGQVTGQITGLIRELRPQIVITFEPYGIYGHPDHILISHCTTQAFDAAGEPTAFPDSGKPWQPQLLYYSAMPLRWFNDIVERLQALRLDTSGLEQMKKIIRENPEQVAPRISHERDVAQYVPAKIDALACHQTQLSPHSPFINLLKPEMADLMAQEFFIQARPEQINAAFFEA